MHPSRQIQLQLSATLVAIAVLIGQAHSAAAQQSNHPRVGPWVSDNGDGTFTNPVLYADYSDLDVVGVDGDYYLTASSFNCVPGLPILHSRDLVNWRIVNHALPRLYDDAFDAPQHGNGVFAPSIRFHDGWCYIYWGDPDRGIYMIRAKDPRGAWSAPVLVKKAYGNIDPCPLWDDDGRVYMAHAFAHSRAGVNSLITVVELSKDGAKAIDAGWIVFDGHAEHPTVEGPKFFKRNGYYYIFAPAGGVSHGWQLVLRSRNIRGPYEERKVLAQGATDVNGPHQGAWVDTPDGKSWFLHFQDAGAYGRIMHLQPVKWVDDWPAMGEDPGGDGVGQPVATHAKPTLSEPEEVAAPATSDEFSAPQLGLQWQWHANPRTDWSSLTERRGWLRLSAVPKPADYRNLWQAPNLLLQKFPAPEFTAECRVDASNLQIGQRAGLLVMGLDYSHLCVERMPQGLRLAQKLCLRAESGSLEESEAMAVCESPVVELRVAVTGSAECSFSYRNGPGEWTAFGGRFPASKGKWIGAKVGFFCQSDASASSEGRVDIDYFLVR